MSQRNTNQKKIILDTLSSMRTHPTINELHEKIKKHDPNIGIATIYRNVKKFVEDGTIYVVRTKEGLDRYDYYGNHAHFECLSCKKIEDLYDDELFQTIKNNFQKIQFVNCNLLINGYCENCKNNKKI